MQTTLKPITLLLASLWFTAVFAQENNDIVIGKKYSLHSNILKEDRPYWVHLPKGYDSLNKEKKYPVLYVLDGDVYFQTTVGVVQFMGNGPLGHTQIPEFIIVSIPHFDRTKDLTPTKANKWVQGEDAVGLQTSGGAIGFLKFLNEELAPHIDLQYNTEKFKVLVGHSFGGLFSVYSLYSGSLFNAFIAMDPSFWWDDNFMINYVQSKIDEGMKFKGYLYMAVAHNEPTEVDTRNGRRVQEDLFSIIELSKGKNLKVKYEAFEELDHRSVYLQALYHGLLFVFEGYNLHPPYPADPNEVDIHFEKLSDDLGFSITSERALQDIAGSFLYVKQFDKGIKYLSHYEHKYGLSGFTTFLLGQAYAGKKEMKKAIEYYKKAVELDPENTYFKMTLDKALED